jgi:nucleotide-binding universal stress UspA family protein
MRILVPLDGSEMSEAVLPYAKRLAGALNAEIVLLHVDVSPAPEFDVHVSPLAPKAGHIKQKQADEKHYIKRVFSQLQEEGLRATYLLRDGSVADTILEQAEIMQADLIAMSTHGRTGMVRILLGSVAEQAVHRSKIPVMLIRPNAGEKQG